MSPDPWVRTEVLAAHDTAVVAALDWFEHHGAVTRRGKDGVDQVDTQGVVAALFRQHTSRTADPQLHTHAVIAAKVQDATCKWLSLDARFLKCQQRSISWVYAAALRTELSGRLGVSWGPVSDGHAEIDGVPGELLAVFSQRSQQVEAKTAELVAAWVDEHDGAEPDARTIYQLQRRAVLASRPAKQDTRQPFSEPASKAEISRSTPHRSGAGHWPGRQSQGAAGTHGPRIGDGDPRPLRAPVRGPGRADRRRPRRRAPELPRPDRGLGPFRASGQHSRGGRKSWSRRWG